MSETENRRPPLALISLGCPKNLSTARNAGAAGSGGLSTTADPAGRAAVIINILRVYRRRQKRGH